MIALEIKSFQKRTIQVDIPAGINITEILTKKAGAQNQPLGKFIFAVFYNWILKKSETDQIR